MPVPLNPSVPERLQFETEEDEPVAKRTRSNTPKNLQFDDISL